MNDKTLGCETYEVPIMLSTDNLTYEDIAKLNPFYEEYNDFWSDSPDALDTSFSSGGLSSLSSLRSISTEGTSFPSPELTPPPLRRFQSHHGLYIPESPKVTLHSCGTYKPAYDDANGHRFSHIAVLDSADQQMQPLSPVNECHEFCDLGMERLDSFDRPLPQTRESHKKLFGQNGWLGCTAELDGRTKSRSRSKALKDLGKKLKQHVEEIAGDVARAYPNAFLGLYGPSTVSEPTVPISLDLPTQAKFYSEMEAMICFSANRFLVQQYHNDRLSKDSIKRINNFWASKNRPQVVEFQFDQATQRRLILSNIRTLHFNGESSTNPVLLHSNLQNWKAIVKEMSVRTFCAPDSVVRKHMHDIHKLLDMLGAPVETFLAFEDIQMRTLSSMKDHRAKNYLFQDKSKVGVGKGKLEY